MSRKKVYVLLTRFPGGRAKLIGTITGSYYTHASIGLDEDRNTFYSFVYKGFIVEKLTRYIKPGRSPLPCQLYELEVSEKVYASVKDVLEHFVTNKSTLRYARLGLAMSLLRIPFKQKHHYFCSQFVADVLKCSRAARLKKDSALYFPGDLKHLSGIRLNFQGNLQGLLNCFEIIPCAA